MTILKDVVTELFGMFLGDARLSAAVLAVVALAAGLIELARVEALVGGGALLAGCLAVTVESVRRAARSRGGAARPSGSPPAGARAGLPARLMGWLDRRRQRRALAELDQRLLGDIGVSHRDAIRESRRLD